MIRATLIVLVCLLFFNAGIVVGVLWVCWKKGVSVLRDAPGCKHQKSSFQTYMDGFMLEVCPECRKERPWKEDEPVDVWNDYGTYSQADPVEM